MIISCRDLARRSEEAREGKLGLVDRLGYRVHRALCRACRVYLAQVDAIVEAARSIARDRRAPQDIHDKVRAALDAIRPKRDH
jgi:anti-sigma factor ChrR (cupin superfamily)